MLQLNRLLSLAVASTIGAAAALASAAEVPKGRDAAEVTSLSALPAAIREHLATQFGDVSDRSGPFNPGCAVLKDVPRHRFVRGSLANDHAVVAVEHGGIAHYVETLEFDNAHGRWEAVYSTRSGMRGSR